MVRGMAYRLKDRNRTYHGMKGHPAWQSWRGMRERCSNPKNRAWKWYGGNGITYVPEWDLFWNFWLDMGASWHPGLTLERIDNDKPYSKANCRWATHSEQAKNRRSTKFLEVNGVRKCAFDWDKDLGGRKGAVLSRIKKGWSVQTAATTPVRKINQRPYREVLCRGAKVCCAEAARLAGLKYSTLVRWLDAHPEFDKDVSNLRWRYCGRRKYLEVINSQELCRA